MAEEKVDKPEVGEAEKFDTQGLLLDYLGHWKWFVISLIICIGLGLLRIATVIPKYRVESAMYLHGDGEDNSSAFSLDAELPVLGMKNFLDETEIEILKSRNNLIKIVDSLNLCYTYYREGALHNIPLYDNNAIVASMDSLSLCNLKSPIHVTIKQNSDSTYTIKVKTKFNKTKEKVTVDAETLPCAIELSHGTLTISRSTAIPEMSGTEIVTIVNPRARAKQMSEAFTIEFLKKSDKIINIAYVDNVPQRGIDIINALLDFYNKDIINDKNQSAIQTEAFILNRLVMISDELRDVENRLQAYRTAHKITDMQTQNALNLSLQSDYQGQLADFEADMAMLDEIERIVSTSGEYALLPAAVKDNSLVEAIEQYNQRVNSLNRALEGSTENSPMVSSMKEELNRQKARILQTIASSKRNLNARIANIQNLENQRVGQLAGTPTVDKGLQEIFREQSVKVNIYTFLLQRREEIAMQKTMAVNTARLIDDPNGDKQTAPKKVIILGIAFVLGLAIPGLIIFGRRMLFPRFSDQEDLKRVTNVPVLGEICRCDRGTHDDIVVGQNVSTPVAELFRLLRNNISFINPSAPVSTILFTSAISGEGKTFVATNLALTYALAGKKTVVIGADVRRPTLAHRFGLDNTRGLSTYLSGQETNVDRLVSQSELNPNLYILPAGPVPPNPNELLMNDNMDKLIAELKERYEYIIIDTAPVGIVSDGYLLVRHSDVQIFITRADLSSRGSLNTLHDAIRMKKFTNAFIVLNDVNIKSGSYTYRRYGAYNSHTYSYKYGYSYTSRHHSSNKK